MAFPGNVNRYVLSGSLPGGERWSIGYYGEATLPGNAQAIANAYGSGGSLSYAFLVQLQKLLSTSSSIDRIDVYTYGSGRTIIDQGSKALSGLAGTGSSPHSNRTSLVLTLRTAIYGARGRGRLYLPANGWAIGTDGLFVATGLQALVDAAAGELGYANARVVSEASSTSNEVTRVDCDRVPDSQRGRSARQTSARVTANVL